MELGVLQHIIMVSCYGSWLRHPTSIVFEFILKASVGASSQPKADVFHYHNPTTQSSMLHSNDSASTPTLQTGGRLPTLGPGAGISPPHRSPSPMNPAISIPSALAELATSALSVAVPLTSDTPDERAARELIDDYEMRGEMGGKRRKPLHERAGWKEMDEQGVRKRGRRRRESSPEEFGVYIDPATGAGTLENDLIRANREMGLPTNLPLSDEVTFAASVDPQLQLAGSGSGDDGDFAAGDRGGVQQGKSGGLSRSAPFPSHAPTSPCFHLAYPVAETIIVTAKKAEQSRIVELNKHSDGEEKSISRSSSRIQQLSVQRFGDWRRRTISCVS